MIGRRTTAWIGSIVLAVTLATTHPPASRAWLWLVLAVGLLCWLHWAVLGERQPSAGRRALAGGTLVTAVWCGLPNDSTAILITALLLGVFVSQPEPTTRTVIAVVAAVTALVALGEALWAQPPGTWFANLGALAIAVFAGTTRRQYDARLLAAELAQQERAHAATAEERTRIARELHDVLAHSLGALRVQLEVAHTLLVERRDPDGAAEHLATAQHLAARGLDDARAAVTALRTDVRPLPDALRELVAAFRVEHDTAAEFTQEGEFRALPAAETSTLLRIARESLTNAARHARGQQVTVRLRYTPDAVQLVVRNDLTGSSGGSHGYGLTGMRERIELVNGSLRAGPDGPSWEVAAEVGSAQRV
jgi:signal transduction histidine kinase